jgi:hypothetical protein
MGGVASALRAPRGGARGARGCERNSALFAEVLRLEHFQETLRALDVDSLARTAAACVAGREAVEALGDAPWLDAIAAIERDLTHGELPPAKKGVYTTPAARAAAEAAYARVADPRQASHDCSAFFPPKRRTRRRTESSCTERQRRVFAGRVTGAGLLYGTRAAV